MNQLSYVEAVMDQSASPALTLLIVEDSPLLVTLFEDFFSYWKYKPVCFKNAQEALDYLDNGHSVDVLIADFKLPGPLNGIDLSCLAKKRLPDLKTIIITGFELEMFQEKEFAEHYAFLRKPFDLFTLKKMVEEIA
jgi:DNA-binding NtrC family response regulator